MIGNIESIINDVRTKINNEKEVLKPIWEGSTSDAFFQSLNKNDEIFNKISEQLASFSSALSEIDKLESLVSERKSLESKLSVASTDEEKQNYQRQINTKNAEIDALVQTIINYLSEVTINSTMFDVGQLSSLAVEKGYMAPGDELTAEVLTNPELQNEINGGSFTVGYSVDQYGIIIKDDGIPRNGTAAEKMNYLFPNGRPNSVGAATRMAGQYIAKTEVEILDENGKPSTMYISVHKDLQKDVQEIFSKIADLGFKVKPAATGAFNARLTAGGSLSHHSYGTAIDINWNDNPYLHKNREGTQYSPNNNEYAITEEVANVFRSYGWSWGGGDWNNDATDYMHFSFSEKGPQDQE